MSKPPPHLVPPPPDWVAVCKEEGRRVRKFPTYGGWLYQVQAGADWTVPVFVPDERRVSSPRVVR